AATLFFEQSRKLCGRSGFSGTVETDDQNPMRLVEIQRRGGAAEQDRQFVIENLNDLLSGGDAAGDGLAPGLVLDPRDEFFLDLKVDIALEQREPNLPERSVDVRFADFSVTAEIFEDLLQLIAELRKQIIFLVSRSAPSALPLRLLRFRMSNAFPLFCR